MNRMRGYRADQIRGGERRGLYSICERSVGVIIFMCHLNTR